jgi:hypothetical protein
MAKTPAPGAGSGDQSASQRSIGSCDARPKVENVAVPDAFASYVIEAGSASDYDHLLLANGAAHE